VVGLLRPDAMHAATPLHGIEGLQCFNIYFGHRSGAEERTDARRCDRPGSPR